MPELGQDVNYNSKQNYLDLAAIRSKNSFDLERIWILEDTEGRRKTVIGLSGGYWYTASGLDVGRDKKALGLLYVIQLWHKDKYKSKDLLVSNVPIDRTKNWYWEPDLGFEEFWSKK